MIYVNQMSKIMILLSSRYELSYKFAGFLSENR